MDVISYGVANKASKKEKDTRNNVLGPGVEGSFPHAKGRIDQLENALQGVVSQADKLIVNDAVNIMKAHAKFNTVAKSMKYKMHNMIFDDLLDLSGIDATKSSGYTHDSALGEIAGGTIETTTETSNTIPEKVILSVEEAKPPKETVNIIGGVGSSYDNGSVQITGSTSNSSNYTYYMFQSSGSGRSSSLTADLLFDFYAGDQRPEYIGFTPSTRNYGQGFPQSFVVQVSNDGTNFTSVLRETDLAFSTSEVKLPLNLTQSYRYIKLIIYSSYGANGSGSDTALELNQLSLYNTIPNEQQITYEISRDAGVTWESIVPETLFYFHDTISPRDTNIRLKATIPTGFKLLNYGLTWS